jgi:hypothetical protein
MLSHAIPESLGLSVGARDARPNPASARSFPQAHTASHLGGRLLLQRCGAKTCAPGSCSHDEELRLARAPSAPATEGGPAPPIVHEVLRSSWRPLEPSTLTLMNQQFGYDFSSVRVHTGNRAEASARSVDALAYTVGRHRGVRLRAVPPRNLGGSSAAGTRAGPRDAAGQPRCAQRP